MAQRHQDLGGEKSPGLTPCPVTASRRGWITFPRSHSPTGGECPGSHPPAAPSVHSHRPTRSGVPPGSFLLATRSPQCFRISIRVQCGWVGCDRPPPARPGRPASGPRTSATPQGQQLPFPDTPRIPHRRTLPRQARSRDRVDQEFPPESGRLCWPLKPFQLLHIEDRAFFSTRSSEKVCHELLPGHDLLVLTGGPPPGGPGS